MGEEMFHTCPVGVGRCLGGEVSRRFRELLKVRCPVGVRERFWSGERVGAGDILVRSPVGVGDILVRCPVGVRESVLSVVSGGGRLRWCGVVQCCCVGR